MFRCSPVTVAVTENSGKFFILSMRDSFVDMFHRSSIPKSSLFAGTLFCFSIIILVVLTFQYNADWLAAENILLVNGPRLVIYYGGRLRVESIENILTGSATLLPLLSLPSLSGTSVYSLHRTVGYLPWGSTEHIILHFISTEEDPKHVWLPIDYYALRMHSVSEGNNCAKFESEVWSFGCERNPAPFALATSHGNLAFSVNVR